MRGVVCLCLVPSLIRRRAAYSCLNHPVAYGVESFVRCFQQVVVWCLAVDGVYHNLLRLDIFQCLEPWTNIFSPVLSTSSLPVLPRMNIV